MKVLYENSGLSLIKALLYKDLTNSTIASKNNFTSNSCSEQTVDANDLAIEELIQKTRKIKMNSLLFSSPHGLTQLEALLDWAFRHKAFCVSKLEKAALQILQNGCKDFQAQKNQEVQYIITLANDVQAEVRLSGYNIHFKVLPYTENILYAKFNTKHHTHDLILQQWVKIYPEYTFVFFFNNTTLIGNRFGHKEYQPYNGKIKELGKKLARSKLLACPHRSKLISRHASFVQDTQRFATHLSSVNYIDFYNRIKKGEILI